MDIDNTRADLIAFEKKRTNHRKDFENTIKIRIKSHIEQVEGKLDDRDARMKDEMGQLKITVVTLEENFRAWGNKERETTGAYLIAIQSDSCTHSEIMMSPRYCPRLSLDVTLPVFENLPTQNARTHLISLSEYMDMRNIPPSLRLAVAIHSLKGPSETSRCIATSDTIELRLFSERILVPLLE